MFLLIANYYGTGLTGSGVSHLLRETHPSLRIESHVFPAYQTRGELVSQLTSLPTLGGDLPYCY